MRSSLLLFVCGSCEMLQPGWMGGICHCTLSNGSAVVGRSCATTFHLRGPWHFSWQSWTDLVLFSCFLISLEKDLIITQVIGLLFISLLLVWGKIHSSTHIIVRPELVSGIPSLERDDLQDPFQTKPLYGSVSVLSLVVIYIRNQ